MFLDYDVEDKPDHPVSFGLTKTGFLVIGKAKHIQVIDLSCRTRIYSVKEKRIFEEEEMTPYKEQAEEDATRFDCDLWDVADSHVLR